MCLVSCDHDVVRRHRDPASVYRTVGWAGQEDANHGQACDASGVLLRKSLSLTVLHMELKLHV